MASAELIEQLLAEAAAMTVRTYGPAAIEDAAQAHLRRWKSTSNKDLSAAFDLWMDAQGEKAPQALPTPNQVWKYHRKIQERGSGNAPDSVGQEFEKASAGFVAGTLELREALALIFKAPNEKHHHPAPTFDPESGEETTPECTACLARAIRVDQMKEAVADLPVPSSGSTDRCRCAGTGWVDTVESFSRTASVEFVNSGEVYPCPKCRFDQFDEWKNGRTRSGEETAA